MVRVGPNALALRLGRFVPNLKGEPTIGVPVQPSDANSAAESAARLQAIVDTAVDAIITIDEGGLIETVNPAAERLFGYSRAELIGKNVSLLMPEPYHSEHDGYLSRYLRTGEARIIGKGREVVGLRKDGSQFPMELAISETVLPAKRFFTGIVRDISARRRAEEALRHSEERLAGIIASAMDAIITIDEQQRIVVFNRAAEVMFRYRAKDVMGRSLDVLIPARYREVHRTHVQDFAATGVTSRSMWRPGTLLALRADGEEFPIEATISQVVSAGQRLYSVILRDITERVRAEAELRRAMEAAHHANRAKDQFLAIMSHELRTPLNAIVGYVDLIATQVYGEVNERQRDGLGRIARSAQHLVAVIEQVLQYARSTGGEQEPRIVAVRLSELLGEVATLIEPLAQEKSIEYHAEIDGGDVVIHTDLGMLRQIVLNLCSNAVKFTQRGSVRVVVGVRGERLHCEVCDTGTGIAESDIARLFEPFWQADQRLTREQGGTGLGLTIARQFIERLGGEVAVHSRIGVGSTFSFSIPLAESSTQAA
jgi:two-component system sensor histidine kinase EvgS